MKITSVVFAPGHSAYYFDDQAAIKSGATQNGFVYRGAPATEGFQAVAVQYSGAAGRDPLFTAERFIPDLERNVSPELVGQDVSSFRELAMKFDTLEIEGCRLHTAVRYGISQALLDATAIATHRQKCEVIRGEWGLSADNSDLPLFGQSGDDRHVNVDKMILREVAALPHGLINNIPNKLGENGGKLVEYVSWLSQRVEALRRNSNYTPKLHIDVYGTIGAIFDNSPTQIADYLCRLERRAFPFELYIEGPCDAGSKSGQIDLLKALRQELGGKDSSIKIVADEWCNTLEDVRDFVDAGCCDMVQIKTPDLGSLHNTIDAVLYCKGTKVETYQGGSCNETDLSARACVHAAFATRPDRVLVKPGMGFDEGMCIVANEASRIQTIINAKEARRDQRSIQAV